VQLPLHRTTLERIHREHQPRIAAEFLMAGDAKVTELDAPRIADVDEHGPAWIAQRDAATGDSAEAKKLSVLFEEVDPHRSAQTDG
jgi:hypothetical protein